MRKYLYYAKNYFLKLLLIFLSVFGLIGTSASLLFSLPQSSSQFCLLILFCFIISIAILLIIYPIKKFVQPFDPKDDWLYNNKEKFKILFPYNSKYLKPANRIAKLYYGKEFTNENVVKSWYNKNPYTLSILANEQNKIIGYFDILPLNEMHSDKFINGQMVEKDIRPKHILSVEEMKQCRTVYIAGIAVEQNCGEVIKTFGGVLIYALITHIKCFYTHKEGIKLLALPVTDCGKKLLTKYNFKIETEAMVRKDKTDLLSKILTNTEIDKLLRDLKVLDQKIDLSAYFDNQLE